MTLFVTLLCLNIITCIVPLLIIIRSLKERPSKGLTNYFLVILCIFMNGIGNLVLFLSSDADAALTAAKICAICKLLCLCCISEFLAEYCHFEVNKVGKIIVGIIDFVAVLGILFTANFKTYFTSYELEFYGRIPVFRYQIGFCYYLYMLIVFITFGGVAIELFLEIKKSSSIKEKEKYGGMLIGITFPTIGIIANYSHIFPKFDMIPITMMMASAMFYYSMEKYEIFDLSQNAKEYVLDRSIEAIMLVDSNKNILYMNNIVKVAEPNLELYQPMDPGYEMFLEQEKTEYSDGERNYEAYRTELKDDNGNIQGYLIEVRDVTKKHQKMKKMNELMEDAELANQAKSTFLSHMSHEIRTPINAVLGMDEMILRETEDPNVREYADNIQNAGKTLLSIINDILDFSKIESGELEIVPEKYELKDILENAKRMVMPRLEGKDIDFEMTFDPKIPKTLVGDANRIQQAMINLLTNAAKYTQEGKITARVGYEKREATINGPEILLKFSVEDTGMGIKKEDLAKLFHSFQRIDQEKNRNIEGTGLGLTITQKLIHKMNGNIFVESEYQKGSVFSFEIPQIVVNFTGIGEKDKKDDSAKENQRYQEKFHAPNAKILVVDDNLVNIKVLQGLLKKTQVQITAVNSGFECLEKITKEQYDLVFMDHMMPEMDGIETLEHIKEMKDNPNDTTPVIVLTANAIAGAREMYLEKGFDDYLMKPVNSEMLENMIIRYLPKELVELV